jgi:hypothetical protein
MYVEKINAAGGVAGKKIDLVIYDDGGDANKARTFATRLIEDDKVVKCGDPAKYPGCTPYSDAEKAEMVASMRRDLENGRVDLENAKRDLAAAEGSLAELEGR